MKPGRKIKVARQMHILRPMLRGRDEKRMSQTFANATSTQCENKERGLVDDRRKQPATEGSSRWSQMSLHYYCHHGILSGVIVRSRTSQKDEICKFGYIRGLERKAKGAVPHFSPREER